MSRRSLLDADGARKYLTPEERTAFLEATQLREADVKYPLQLMYYTGCRPSEALQVTPNRLDYRAQTVTFRTAKQGTDAAGEQRVRFRQNELPARWLQEMQGAYSILRSQKSKRRGDEPIWGFGVRTLYNYVTRVMAAAGIDGPAASPKGLRHGFGVALALENVPASTIQQVLGHASIKNTLIYLDVHGEARRSLVGRAW